jgi:hypothetical protein
MKTRKGFVSNSSSSSYIVDLPEDFNPDQFLSEENITKIKEQLQDYQKKYIKDIPKIKQDLDVLLKNGFVVNGYFNPSDIDTGVLSIILRPFVVFTYDGGPDNDDFIVVTKKRSQ